jgi:hypothetical protein
MEPPGLKISIGSQLSQVAWVVRDIKTAERFFRQAFGITNFIKVESMRAQEFEGTYYGQPADFEWHVYIAYSGGAFIELIQPVSGQSIFQDYLEKNPTGGIQHVAYSIPISNLDQAISLLTGNGYPVITSLNMPVAKIVFFDTYKEIGVATEIIGITEEGEEFVQKLKDGKS